MPNCARSQRAPGRAGRASTASRAIAARIFACLALLSFAAIALGGCPGRDPASSGAPIVSASPEIGSEIDPQTSPLEFEVTFELGSRGLGAGQRIELLLFPMRGDFDWRGIAINGEVLSQPGPGSEPGTPEGPTGRVEAAPFARASYEVDEPGGSAGIRVRVHSELAPGARLSLRFAVDALPARRYARREPARLALPVRIYAADGALETTLDTLAWPVATEPAARLEAHLPSQARVGEPVPLVASLLSRDFNPAWEEREVALTLPADARGPGQFPLRLRDRGSRTVTLHFDEPGIHRVTLHAGATKSAEALQATSNPIVVGPPRSEGEGLAKGTAIYWGDLHNHTRFSFDSRNRNLTGVTAAEEVDLARKGALLDFLAITDHGQNGLDGGDWTRPTRSDMSRSDWTRYSNEVRSLEPPDLAVYLGYEHNDARGHTCMVFRDRARYFIEGNRRLDHREVWARQPPGSLLSIPHLHPLRGIENFEASSPHETLVEIYSKWGPYEYYRNDDPAYPDSVPRGRDDLFAVHERAEKGPFVRDLLAAGKRYGFVGSSDHGAPGRYGLTAALVEGTAADSAGVIDRDAIFDALLARRSYATTGARMRLSFRVDDRDMGEEVEIESGDPRLGRRVIALEISAVSPIDRFEVLRNGEAWYREEAVGVLDLSRELVDSDPLEEVARVRPLSGEASTEYYLRVVQQDGHIAWSSPVYLRLP